MNRQQQVVVAIVDAWGAEHGPHLGIDARAVERYAVGRVPPVHRHHLPAVGEKPADGAEAGQQLGAGEEVSDLRESDEIELPSLGTQFTEHDRTLADPEVDAVARIAEPGPRDRNGTLAHVNGHDGVGPLSQ